MTYTPRFRTLSDEALVRDWEDAQEAVYRAEREAEREVDTDDNPDEPWPFEDTETSIVPF